MESFVPFFLLLTCTVFVAQVKPSASQKWQKWSFPSSERDAAVQEQEVYALLERLKANLSSQFDVQIEAAKFPSFALTNELEQQGAAVVSITKTNVKAKVSVVASSGVTASWGIHHYLKYYVGFHMSWDTLRTCK